MANPLTFDRKALVDALEAKLAQNETDRKAKQDEVDKANAGAKSRLADLVSKYPEFLVWLNDTVRAHFTEALTSEDLDKRLQHHYGPGLRTGTESGSTHDPDAELKRMIRVFKAAASDTVEIEEHEHVLNYI